MSTAVCISFVVTPHQTFGIKATFSNAVGCEFKFLKIDPEIKNPLILSVQYDNLMRVNGCRLTLVREFFHISGVVWFTIENPVSTRSHCFNDVAFFTNLSSFRFLDSVYAATFLSFLAIN